MSTRLARDLSCAPGLIVVRYSERVQERGHFRADGRLDGPARCAHAREHPRRDALARLRGTDARRAVLPLYVCSLAKGLRPTCVNADARSMLLDSGHGSRVKSKEGDEKDGYDESESVWVALCVGASLTRARSHFPGRLQTVRIHRR